MEIPAQEAEQKWLLRALMNVREPKAIDPEFLRVQDAYLQQVRSENGVVHVKDLEPIEKGIVLWKGDITRLDADAIVNAANSGMLGCFHPNHGCIDNAIHTYAGVQLRLECEALMEKQGYPEKTGAAKITKAYNLPARYVIHTVGPIVAGRLTELEFRQLASCYRACLELAAAHHLKNIAFCCISTGEFHFPPEKAAQIAIDTVRAFQKEHGTELEVIFNVFKESDEAIYKRLLLEDRKAERGN